MNENEPDAGTFTLSGDPSPWIHTAENTGFLMASANGTMSHIFVGDDGVLHTEKEKD